MDTKTVIELAGEAGLFSKLVRNGFTNDYIKGLEKLVQLASQKEQAETEDEPYAYVTDELHEFVLFDYVKLAHGFPPLSAPDTQWIPLFLKAQLTTAKPSTNSDAGTDLYNEIGYSLIKER